MIFNKRQILLSENILKREYFLTRYPKINHIGYYIKLLNGDWNKLEKLPRNRYFQLKSNGEVSLYLRRRKKNM